MTNMLTATESRLLAIPSRVTRLLIGQTEFQKICDLIYGEIEMALKELSDYDPQKFEEANEEYLAWIGAAKPETD